MASENIKNNIRLITFTVLLTAFFVTLLVIFSSISSVTTANITQKLQQFAAFVSSESDKSGKTGNFTYGKIDVAGWGADRQATVSDLDLALARKDAPSTTKWSFTTSHMQVQSEASSPNNYVFSFADPIRIYKNGQPESSINLIAPLKYNYRDGYQNEKHIVSHTLMMPGQITVVPAALDGMPEVRAGKLVVTYDANPNVSVDILPDDHQRQSLYEFHNIKLDAGTGDTASIGFLSSHLGEESGQGGHPHGKYNLTLNDIVLNEGGKTTSPYNITADIDYNGDQPSLPLGDLAGPFNGSSLIIVNGITLSTDKFSIKAQGALTMSTGETLPYGVLGVVIENMDQLLASEMIPEWSRQPLQDLIKRITGSDVAAPHVAFPLRREKGGVIYVGNITLSDAYAAVLAALQKPATPVAPPAPAGISSTAPAKTPAPVTSVQTAPVAAVAPAAAAPKPVTAPAAVKK